MKILITGASGFIGSFLCEEGLRRGLETWAGMREHSSRRWLQHEKLRFAFLDLTDREHLRSQLTSYRERVGRWDVIIHAAGATKCLRREDFFLHNFQCTQNLVDTLDELDMLPGHFIYVSSLSVLGAIRERPDASGEYADLAATDTPQPNTAYGQSKARSEAWLAEKRATTQGRLRYTIYRPTGVYGPRERDYYMMAKSIQQHLDLAVGYKRQVLTFVYVRDLVSAIFAAIGKTDVANGKVYHVSDGCNYSSHAFSQLIQRELGTKCVLHIKAPLFVLKAICTLAEWWSHITRKPTTLNGDKYKIMSQRNWQCDIQPLQADLGYTPQWPLARGVKETIAWYKANHWL